MMQMLLQVDDGKGSLMTVFIGEFCLTMWR